MGSCWSNTKIIVPGLPPAGQLSYQPDCNLRIVKRDSVSGNATGYEKVKITLKRPILDKSHIVTLDGRDFWTSYCVLPGQDPHSVYPKECQDLCFVESDSHHVLLGLYDGHGLHGQEVVNFCADDAKQRFKTMKTEMHVQVT